jgi:protein tyrosine phosphatase (PTP) superfamily phosphohydrolase (DUF442 family)
MKTSVLAFGITATVSAALLALLSACGEVSDPEATAGVVAGESLPKDGKAPAAAPTPAPGAHEAGRHADDAHAAPLHKYNRLSERISMGASPGNEKDFEFLAAQGVKTILTVDGARPDIETAAKHGIRYVHIPIGYDGISSEKQAWIANMFQDLDGPFYVHCHHGKHRGPAACMIGRLVLDELTPEQAVAEMKAQGTDAKYKGLYAVPGQFASMPAETRAKAPKEFPAAAKVGGMTASMVEVDNTFERLKLVKAAGWAAPQDHPDVDPPHEATILAEHYRELSRSEDVAKRDESFQKLLKVAEDASVELSNALRAKPVDSTKAAAAYDAVLNNCSKCHTLYRDNK